VVDDNPRDLEFLTLAFESHNNVNVVGETRPVKALDRIRTERPALVVLDVKMPELDGFGLLAKLRREGYTAPVVMCSGSARQKDVNLAYSIGCNGYVEKPASLADYRLMAGAILNYWRKGELPQH
jgi:CheY-like chemotaxis protein